jgi:hypothetical protein
LACHLQKDADPDPVPDPASEARKELQRGTRHRAVWYDIKKKTNCGQKFNYVCEGNVSKINT